MASNIEIKARAKDWDTQKKLAASISESKVQRLVQEDVFFNVTVGRLKLRILGPDNGELIYYERPDTSAAKTCNYWVSPTAKPPTLLETLTKALGVRGIVKKKRQLYLSGQMRIHLDEVERLGRYIELEYVMKPDELAKNGEKEVQRFLRHLGIEKEDIVGSAYIDLIAPLKKVS
jgi:predicted adenylyl cyclase CyaB